MLMNNVNEFGSFIEFTLDDSICDDHPRWAM